MPDNSFTNVPNPADAQGTPFDNVSMPNVDPSTPALPNKTLIMALSRVNSGSNPTMQLSEDAIATAKNTIETGQEMSVRNQIAAQRALGQAASLNRLKMDGANLMTPEQTSQVDSAYNNVLSFDAEKKARSAMEQQAIENIQDMAARDPIQAQVLMDNLQHGGADQVLRDHLVIQAQLAQRSEELSHEQNQEGWGSYLLNKVLSLVPTTSNFQKSGIVDGSANTWGDFFASGQGLQHQSETMYSKLANMSPDEAAKFLAADGPLMAGLRANSKSWLGTFDPETAKSSLGALTNQSDNDRGWSNLWGVADAASLIPLTGIGKVGSSVKTLLRAGARKEALDTLEKGAETIAREGAQAAAEKTGVTAEDLRAAQSTSHVDPSVTSDFSVTPSMDLAARTEAAKDALDKLPGIIQEQRLTSSDEIMAAYQSTLEQHMQDVGRPIKDYAFKTETLAGGNGLRYLETVVGKKDGGGYAKEATASNAAESMGLGGEAFRDETGQWFVRTRTNVAEDGFFTNPFHTPTQGFISRLTGAIWRSPSRTTDETLHGKAVVAGSGIGRQQRIIGEQLANTFRGINKESQDVVTQVALQGANNKKWWTPEEFNDLVTRYKGRDATEAELGTYQKLQLYNDMDWVLRNDQQYLQKAVNGSQSLKFDTKSGHSFDIDGHVNYNPKMLPTQRVYNLTENVHYTSQNNPLTGDRLKELTDSGYVMVKPHEAINLPDGTTVDHILARKSDLEISPLRRNQLAYSEGGHRLYTDKYFVKQASVGRQADTGSEFLRNPATFVTGKNIAEVTKWADTMNEARLAVKGSTHTAQQLDDLIFKGNTAFPTGKEFMEKVASGAIHKDHPFEPLFDREMPAAYKTAGENVSNFVNPDEAGFNGYYRTTGRMYTSSKGDILRDTKGDLSPTVDPYEALSTSLKQVTRESGLFNYKQESLERFLSTYKSDLEIPSGASNYSKFDTARVKAGVSRETANAIEAHRFAIRNVLGFQTPGDRLAQQMWRTTAEAVIGDGSNAGKVFAHDAVWWFKNNNPLSFLRGLAFDSKLGLWNVGQIFTQSSTMISALALSPRMGMKGMASLPFMHAFLMMKEASKETLLDTLVKKGIHKTIGFEDAAEFKEYARIMNKSGFMDMNGSHIMIGENGPTAHFGTFVETQAKVREAGRALFYKAEVNNRLIAYRIAWDEARSAGLKPGQDGFLAKLMKGADDYSLNMTHESSAQWQKGIWSIPTQFWSYNIRMMDAMIGNRFTPAQRLRLVTANLAVAGTAGTPITAAIASYMKDNSGVSPDINSLAGTLDRGVLDKIVYEMSGANVRIGEKVGTGTWLPNTVKDIFGASDFGQKNFADIIGGATYGIVKQSANVLYNATKYAAAESGSDMGPSGLQGDAWLKLANQVSSVGNTLKAVLAMNYGIFKSANGTNYPNIPKEDAFFLALGYQPQEIDSLGHRMAFLKNEDTAVKQAATQINNWRQEAFLRPDTFEENMKKSNAFVRLLPVTIQRKVLKEVNHAKDNVTLYDHITQKYNQEVQDEKLYSQLQGDNK